MFYNEGDESKQCGQTNNNVNKQITVWTNK